MSEQNFDETLRQYNLAMSEFFKGNLEPINSMYSKSDEISLAQLSGPFVIGRNQVTSTAINNATKYRDGITKFETLKKYVSPEFAYVVQVERTNAKIEGNNELSPLALRVTRYLGEIKIFGNSYTVTLMQMSFLLFEH